MICNVDIVEQQLLIAHGHPLSIKQDEISPSGTCIEARICTDDPNRHFYPSIGTLGMFRLYVDKENIWNYDNIYQRYDSNRFTKIYKKLQTTNQVGHNITKVYQDDNDNIEICDSLHSVTTDLTQIHEKKILYTSKSSLNNYIVRADMGYSEGQKISPSFDSMLGKVLAYAPNRDDSIKLLSNALDGMVIHGVEHNVGFIQQVLKNPLFLSDRHTTDFISYYENKYGKSGQLYGIIKNDDVETKSQELTNNNNNNNDIINDNGVSNMVSSLVDNAKKVTSPNGYERLCNYEELTKTMHKITKNIISATVIQFLSQNYHDNINNEMILEVQLSTDSSTLVYVKKDNTSQAVMKLSIKNISSLSSLTALESSLDRKSAG